MCYSDVRSSLSPGSRRNVTVYRATSGWRSRRPSKSLKRLVRISRLRIKASLWGRSISANSDHEPVAALGDRSTGPLRKTRSSSPRSPRKRKPGGGVFNKPHDVPRDDSRSWILDEAEAESAAQPQGH